MDNNNNKDNTDKNVYYIDGNIPAANRDIIKQFMEDDEEGNTIVKDQVQEVEENKKLMDELKNNVNRPAILDLLRSIN